MYSLFHFFFMFSFFSEEKCVARCVMLELIDLASFFFLTIQVKNFRADELMEFYKVSNRLRLFCYLTFELAIHSSINYCHIW